MTGEKKSQHLSIREAASQEDLDIAFEIRRRVFVDEQNVMPEHERDAVDDHAVHVLASLDGAPVATARLFIDAQDGQTAWIGRLAVLPESRRNGVACAILEYLLDWSRRHRIERVRLHAQEYVCRLYQKLGFEPSGDVFLEENIPHIEMELHLVENTEIPSNLR